MTDNERDAAIRLAAFTHLARLTDFYGEELHRKVLYKGFDFGGERIALMAQHGIFRPKQLKTPLTLTTSANPRNRDYQDGIAEDFISYKYQGDDPEHRDNVGMRRAMELGRPLIYFFGIGDGYYLAFWPVYILDDNRAAREVRLAAGALDQPAAHRVAEPNDPLLKYCTAAVRARIHHRKLRERVLAAYRRRCAVCRLKYPRWLDAAHITLDAPGSRPGVPNRLSLCKLHHVAFDRHLLGINPRQHRMEVRRDLLHRADFPLLQPGLQELQGSSIELPRNTDEHPDPAALEERYEQFRLA